MHQNSPDQSKLEVLIGEYGRLCDDIRLLETRSEKIIGLGFTVVGAGITYGLKENLVEVFLFLPIAMIGVFLYAGQQYYNLFWLGGYKRAVEDKINKLAGQIIVYWEALVETERGRVKLRHVGLSAIYFVSIVAVSFISIFKVFEKLGPTIASLLAATILSLVAILIAVLLSIPQGYRQAYKVSSEKLLSAIETDSSTSVSV